MIVTPSILTTSVEDAIRQIERLSPFFNYFQIDIADGKFVQNTTLSVEEFAQFVKINPNLPILQTSLFDFHLMVMDFEKDLSLLRKIATIIRIKNVFIHIQLKPNYATLKRDYPEFVIGLVFNPEDGVQKYSTIYSYLDLDIVQIMSVKPGAQGQSFLPQTLQKSYQLKSNGYRNKIFLDGGINAETLPVILSNTPPFDGIGPGSYFSKAENIREQVEELQQLCIKAGISPILKVT